jgi:hypothetical protein
MKKLIKSIFALLFERSNEDSKINIGDHFLLSYRWKTKDPFEKKEIKTVVVCDIKKGYIQYYYLETPELMLSIKKEYFKKICKKI